MGDARGLRRLAVVGGAVIFAFVLATEARAETRCPERPACRGCGCKGGPGYRGPDGRCVGFKALTRVCGDPPTLRCTFENAPGTGANRDCALAPAQSEPSPSMPKSR